jgi:hypothetical protein
MRTALLVSLLLIPCVVCAQQGWRKEGGEGAWAKRTDHNTESYDGRLWAFNGRKPGPTAAVDVWSSPDGVNWTEELPAVPWYNRTSAATAA